MDYDTPPLTTRLCRAADSALLVIDVQTRLAGAMPEADRQQLLRNSTILIKAARALDIPILHTEQYPRGLGHTEPVLAGLLNEHATCLEKTAFSCCAADGFDAAACADGRTQWILCGMEAHVCVLQTAFDLHARGMQIFIVEDAVCSRDPRNRDNGLARLRQAGLMVSNTESVLFEWVKDAEHPWFREMAGLVK